MDYPYSGPREMMTWYGDVEDRAKSSVPTVGLMQGDTPHKEVPVWKP